MDFIIGAAMSVGGKPIIALTSITKNVSSKIVSFLKQGIHVVKTKAHVHFAVTKYGVPYLYEKTTKEQVRLLINIAHPNHKEHLEKSSKLLFA